MNSYNISKLFLYLFITLSITNTIEWLYFIKIFSQYGKIIIVLIGIIIFSYFSIKDKVLKLNNVIYLITFLTLLVIFAILFFYHKNISFYDSIFKTLMYIMYIIFIYYIVNNISLYYLRHFPNKNAKELVLLDIATIFQKTILINIIIWTVLAIILHQSLYDADPTGGRSGFSAFTGDRMAFGLMLVTIYISTFILISTEKQNNLINKVILIFLFILTIYSDARTAIMIEIIFTIIYYFQKKIKYLEFYIMFMFFILVYIAFYNFNISDLEKYSSGRVFIWLLVLKEKINDIWNGSGLFNFNHHILIKYRHLSYYFQRIDYLNFHSSYIEIFAGGGILTLFLYFIFIYKTYIKANKINKSIIFAISLGGCLEGYITQPAIILSSFFWIIVILSNLRTNINNTI